MAQRYDTAALKAALPVADYCAHVGIKLRKVGAEMRGTCPFCDYNKRNEFAVRDAGFFCHHCGLQGDVITLAEQYERISNSEAIQRIADLVGVDGVELSVVSQVKKAESRAKRAARALERARATAAAPAYWDSCARKSEPGRAYLRSRGVDAVHGEVRFLPNAIAFPLHDAHGKIINVVQRTYGKLGPKDLKTRGLTGCTTLGTFGSLADAEHTTGPIIIVEGGPDFLSARVLVPSALVLGAQGANRLPDVVKMASAVAVARGLLVVPHLGDSNHIGARKMTQAIAAARTAGVGNIRRFELATGDLNDFLVAGGTGAELLDAPLIPNATAWPHDELGGAHRYADLNRDRLRYFPAGGDSSWMVWTGKVWQQTVQACEPIAAIDRVLESLQKEAATGEHSAVAEVKAMRTAKRISSTVRLAKSADMKIQRTEFDQHDMLLTVPNGTIDLSSGELLPHNREHMITASSPIAYDPGARAPRWARFLAEVFEPNPDGAEFLARYAGYALTARMDAQCLLFAHGHQGRNGKGIAFRAIQGILGHDLAGGLPMEMLVRRKGTPSKVNPYYAYARIARCRAVFLSETSKGDEIDTALVKGLTGGDLVSARAPAEKGFDYVPKWKLFLAGNNLPAADADDDAFWARFLILPFMVSFRDRRDDTIDKVLETERPGILAWAVRGCLDWLARGGGIAGLLDGAHSVTTATQAYRKESDDLGEFLTSNTRKAEANYPPVKRSALYARYRRWATARGGEVLSARALHTEMDRRGHERKKRGDWFYTGLALLPE